MLSGNWLIDNYFYENGKLTKGVGLVKVGEDYYYIRSDGSIYTNGTITITASKMYKVDGIKPGDYTFDENGRMINPPADEP
jgi:hypothetical protein